MFTQCSNCDTVFKLSADLLRAAGGQVRCGNCGEVFNALARLSEDANVFVVRSESPHALEKRADSILETTAEQEPVPEPESAEESGPPGVEIAHLQILDPVSDPSLEFTLPPGELDSIFKPAPPHPEAEPDPVRFEILSGMESEQLQDLRPPRPRGVKYWLTAALVLTLLLAAQVVHHSREYWATHGPFAAAVRSLYARAGAPVASSANLSAYQLRQWGVSGDPSADGTLRVRASILNAAAQLEPFPLLRVTLANRFGTGIGARDFEPSEYLGKPTARYLNPGEQIDATMDILDPGKNAEGFEIDVCLRGADRKISCANDTAPAQTKR